MSSEVEKLVEKWNGESRKKRVQKAILKDYSKELRAAIAKDGERERKLVEALRGIQHLANHSDCNARDMYRVEEISRAALAAYDPQAQPNGGAK